MLKKIKGFIAKETVLCVAAVCAAATMLIIPPDREYLHYIDFRVLCLLLCLMAVVAGLKAIGTFQWLTYQLLNRIQNGRLLSVTLVLLPFFCSMFVTNDVALIIFGTLYAHVIGSVGMQKRNHSHYCVSNHCCQLRQYGYTGRQSAESVSVRIL